MFVNLHLLPRGISLFTAHLSGGDEIDFTAPARATGLELIAAAKATEDYREGYAGQRIVGLVDQSAGYVLSVYEGES